MDHAILESNINPVMAKFTHSVIVDFSRINMGRMPIEAKRTLIEMVILGFGEDDPYLYIVDMLYYQHYGIEDELESNACDVVKAMLIHTKHFRRVVESVSRLLSVSIPLDSELGVYGWGVLNPLVGYLWVD